VQFHEINVRAKRVYYLFFIISTSKSPGFARYTATVSDTTVVRLLEYREYQNARDPDVLEPRPGPKAERNLSIQKKIRG
jgi:hypothetical protein